MARREDGYYTNSGIPPYGFRARLGIYWPAKAQPEMIKGHQWHLACEFVNWTRMYVESRST